MKAESDKTEFVNKVTHVCKNNAKKLIKNKIGTARAGQNFFNQILAKYYKLFKYVFRELVNQINKLSMHL